MAGDKNGSETVKITGSILAQQEGAPVAIQASRNARVSGLEHFGDASQGSQQTQTQQDLSQLRTQQQLANVFGSLNLKESRNKNHIQNPQVTKNSMQSNTLEKLAGSAQKLQKQTLVQP